MTMSADDGYQITAGIKYVQKSKNGDKHVWLCYPAFTPQWWSVSIRDVPADDQATLALAGVSSMLVCVLVAC